MINKVYYTNIDIIITLHNIYYTHIYLTKIRVSEAHYSYE